ncbi:hypothetical protein ABI59_23495 [Acidobacteria bacterium Mor1]|nr:hypothetical protein ABI59_23495 [Acidobacteria bacterium Mor1]
MRAWTLNRSDHSFRLSLLLIALVFALPCWAQEGVEPPAEALVIDWVPGPGVGELGSVATLEIPEGFIFAGPEDTRKLMTLMQNPLTDMEMGFIAPAGESDEEDWFIVFEFDPVGYVKDDEQADLDADALLESMKEGSRQSNKLREERGWETLELVGWVQPPHYDTASNNLEWGTRLRSGDNHETVNYNSRLLGRRGVMSATFVGSEQQLMDNREAFHGILSGHDYVAGQRYAEFQEGDKIAEYGLAALVTGGVAAVALKSGILQKAWKFIVLAVVGAGAFLRRFFRKSEPEPAGDGDATA